MKNKPPYAVESVDNALRILQALRDSGRLRVSEIAQELGIARSTAHRLLSMLVYRDFAIRSEDHSYLPGPALSAPPLHGEPMARLRSQLRPHAEALRDQLDETVNLQVRLGAQTRFLYTAESTQVLRVGDRQGTILPAWVTSGGKALLAALSDEQVAAVLRTASGRPPQGLTVAVRRALFTELRLIREQGWAENIEESESGLCAVGMCVRDSGGTAVAALSVAAPAARYSPDKARLFVAGLTATVSAAAAGLPSLRGRAARDGPPARSFRRVTRLIRRVNCHGTVLIPILHAYSVHAGSWEGLP